MMRRRSTYLFAVGIVACATSLALLAQPQQARGIASDNKHTVVPTPNGVSRLATYVIGEYNVANNETITRVAVTFPAGCNVGSALPATAGDTLTVSGQTVTVTFGTPKAPGTAFSIRIGNIRNPPTAGSYTLVNPVTFTRSTGVTVNVTLNGKRGEFDIVAGPYLLLTIDTPDDPQSVDFGSVDPGVAAPPKTVQLTVDSSLNFTITRTVSGDVALMGLTVGALPATVQLAGLRTFNSVFNMTPPWTTDPNVPLSASVVYTATQQ